MRKTHSPKLIGAAAAIAFALAASPALSSPARSGGGHDEQVDTGKPGKASNATRTVTVTMYDTYYEPEKLTFKEGETVRFIIENKGELVHEFNIATAAMHKAHAPEMMMMMEQGVLEPDKINMEAAKQMQAKMGHGLHKAPNSALLEPGKSAEIVWTFPEETEAELEYACNVPGHYESGMVGKIKLDD